MSPLKRLVTVAAACAGLLVVGAPALADSTDPGSPVITSSATTVDDAGISSAGMASRAPGATCGKKAARRSSAQRSCGQRQGQRHLHDHGRHGGRHDGRHDGGH